MQLEMSFSPESMTVFLEGEIDHHIAKRMRNEIDEMLDRQRPKTLVLDFRSVTFMDSSGIGLIMGRYKKLQIWNGALEVVNVSHNILKVMRLAGLEKIARLEQLNTQGGQPNEAI